MANSYVKFTIHSNCSEAYRKGIKAGFNNVSYPDSGPYKEGTEEYKEFWDGYRVAQEELEQ